MLSALLVSASALGNNPDEDAIRIAKAIVLVSFEILRADPFSCLGVSVIGALFIWTYFQAVHFFME